MKNTLVKKALRDISKHLGAYLACAMLMAIGVTFYSSMNQVVENLFLSQQRFYDEYRFADAFANVRSLPADRMERLEAIPGVEKVSGRLVYTAKVVTEEKERNIELQLISYDPAESDKLNDVLISDGDSLQSGQYQLLLSQSFYQQNGFAPGDPIELSVQGRRIHCAAAGSVMSPEFVYLVPEGSMLPDDKNYGVAYLPLDVMEQVLSMNGTVNDIAFRFDAGTAYDDIQRSLEESLSPGGLIRLLPRKDQASHSMLDLELQGIQAMAGLVPIIFLLLGALVMSVVIKRMVEQQHAQIGLMKAFGYSQLEVMQHYMIYGVAIGLAASIIGGVLGALVADYIADLYTSYFVLPGISGSFSLSNVAALSLLALAFGVGASLFGARGVLRLGAAEAMRPPAPSSGKAIFLERIPALWFRLQAVTQLSLRNLFRSRGRSLLTAIGLTVCYALTAAVFAFNPMVDLMMNENFFAVQKYDYKINLIDMAESRTLESSLSRINGVEKAEAILEMPLTLRFGANSKDVVLLALPENSEMYCLFDRDNQPLPLPSRGLMLTYRMADELGVRAGDQLLLDAPFVDKKATVTVAGLCEQYTSNYAITELSYLSTALHMSQAASGALVRVDAAGRESLPERLKQAGNVASTMDVNQVFASMNETLQTSMSMLYVMALMAVFSGFAIVYNASIVILSERTRELASMRVLGFSLMETVRVVAVEQLLLCLAGIAFGIPLAGMAMSSLSQAMASDMFSIPTDVPLSSHITSIACMMGAWLGAMWVTSRKVRKTSMSEVLKERD